MKTNALKLTVSALLLGVLVVPMAASAATNDVNRRLENQHVRIEQGNRSGELTRKEDRKLAVDESRIRYQSTVDRYRDHGKLTTFQRARLNRELNRSSRAVYNLKHNDRVRPNS